MHKLEFRDFSFDYPSSACLDKISFSVEEGEICLVIGNSGEGKTTLLQSIFPSIAPHGKREGQILFEEKEISKAEEAKLAFLSKDTENSFIFEKVWHEMAFLGENRGIPKTELKMRIAEIMNFFGIEKLYERNTDSLSGGEKKLLQIASKAVSYPEVFVMDEITSSLDLNSAEKCISLIEKMKNELGLTFIIAEHNVDMLFPIADKVVFLNNGKVEFCLPPFEAASRLFSIEKKDFIPPFYRFSHVFGLQSIPSLMEAKELLKENEFRFCEEKEEKRSAEEVISLSDVSFSYSKNSDLVLDLVSFSANEGSITAILGQNGVGKSTLLDIISGLKAPCRGKIRLFGKCIRSEKELTENSFLVMQDTSLMLTENTVFDTLKNVCTDENKIREFAEEFGLFSFADRNPRDLSDGQKELLCLLTAILSDKKIILLDEVTGNVEKTKKALFINAIRKMKSSGKVIILATHDFEFAADLKCDVTFLFGKRLSEKMPSLDFFMKNRFVKTFASKITDPDRGFASTTDFFLHLEKLK